MVSLETCMVSEDDEGNHGDFIEFSVADSRREFEEWQRKRQDDTTE